MIKHPDLTALTPVVSATPAQSAAEPQSATPTAPFFASSYTLVPENPFGPGHVVAGQQAAALANLFAAAQALQAAAAELALWEPSSGFGAQPEGGERILHPSFTAPHSPEVPLARSVASLFEAFASLRNCLLDSSLSLSSRLVHDIFSVTHDRTAELTLIGITLAPDGSLEVDRSALQRAAQASPELLEAILAGPRGLAARLRRLSLEVSVSVQNIFAAMTPATPGLASLPSRLAQLFGQALVAG